jgi:O-acetylserine/cysteine efflux transporter
LGRALQSSVFARKFGRDGGVGMLKANALGSLPQLMLATLILENGQIEALRSAGTVEWSMLAFVGIVGFYLAYMSWYSLLKSCRMDEVAPFILLMPVVGVVTAYLGLRETIFLIQVLGGLVILAGLVIVSGVGLPPQKRGRVIDTAPLI